MERHIRQASPSDARDIAEVHVRTWQEAYEGLVPQDYLDALDVDQRVDAYERLGVLADPDRPVFVCELGTAIVGFAGVGCSEDDADLGRLYSIYVRADQWGSGVGPALMSEAEEWLGARFPAAILWVLEENTRARRFYERCGWRPDKESKEDDRGSFVLHEIRYTTVFAEQERRR